MRSALRFLAALCLALPLSGCLGLGLGPLLGSGPKVAANGQAGATNAQTLGQSNIARPTVKNATVGTLRQTGSSTSQVQAETVRRIVINQVPWWVTPGAILLALVAFMFGRWVPSDREILMLLERRRLQRDFSRLKKTPTRGAGGDNREGAASIPRP